MAISAMNCGLGKAGRPGAWDGAVMGYSWRMCLAPETGNGNVSGADENAGASRKDRTKSAAPKRFQNGNRIYRP
jgi:hypothetical protein